MRELKLKKLIKTGSKLHSLVCDKYDEREKELEEEFMQKNNIENREDCFYVCPHTGAWEERIPELEKILGNDEKMLALRKLENHFYEKNEKMESLLKKLYKGV